MVVDRKVGEQRLGQPSAKKVAHAGTEGASHLRDQHDNPEKDELVDADDNGGLPNTRMPREDPSESAARVLPLAIVCDDGPFGRVQVPHDEMETIRVVEPALKGEGEVTMADAGQVGRKDNIAPRIPTKDKATVCGGLVAEGEFEAIQGVVWAAVIRISLEQPAGDSRGWAVTGGVQAEDSFRGRVVKDGVNSQILPCWLLGFLGTRCVV